MASFATEVGVLDANCQEKVYPLLIVGAGQHALSLITKLMEPSFDNLEENPTNKVLFKSSGRDGQIYSKYRFLPDHIFTQKDATIRSKWRSARRSESKHKAFLDNVCVIDKNKEWLMQWEHQFEVLGIPMLRSTTRAHPDPVDPQCLRIHLEDNGERDSSVVTVNLDRDSRYHGPYEVPKTATYNLFCKDIVKRYHLEQCITQGTVVDVRVTFPGEETEDRRRKHIFEVRLGDGRLRLAKVVIFATGPLNIPVYPSFYTFLEATERKKIPPKHFRHSCSILWAHNRISVHDLSAFENLLIVGGGLTAGHLAVRAINIARCNCVDGRAQHVSLLTRRPLQSRQFDLDLQWMGRERNSKLASFWSSSDYEERFRALLGAKNGGSMTPEVLRELDEGTQSGLFSRFEDDDIDYAYFDHDERKWEVRFRSSDEPFYFDCIWCATGTKIDVNEDPIFQGLLPYMTLVDERMPVLTDCLQVNEKINAFVMGEHAGLALGPGSVNLMGGRAGAARIAEALRGMLDFAPSHTTAEKERCVGEHNM